MPILRIIRGLPGSGKSTFANKKYPNIFKMETDMFNTCDGKYEWNMERQKEAITCHEDIFDVILDKKFPMDFIIIGVFGSVISFLKYVQKSIINGYNVEIYTMTSQYESVHNIAKEDMEKMKENFCDNVSIGTQLESIIPSIYQDRIKIIYQSS